MSNEARAASPGAPLTPLWLAMAGLAPFFAGALLPWLGGTAWLSITAVYGACVLCFTGGVQWGALLAPHVTPAQVAPARLAYVLAVVPVLAGWVVLLLPLTAASPPISVVVLMLGFLGTWAVDQWMCRRGWTPPWYLRLRTALTAAVLPCLGSVLARLLHGG